MDIFKDYLKEVEKHLQQGNATEHSYRRALENLLYEMATSAQVKALNITNEPKHSDFGVPDFVASQPSKSGPLIIGYLECKDIGKDLDQEEKSEQMRRYLAAQPNVILTDYLEFRWYLNHRQKFIKQARLGSPSPKGKIQIDPDGAEGVSQILKGFLQKHPAQIVRAKDLSLRLASLTQIIRDIIVHAFDSKSASQTLQSILQAFRQTLIPDLKEPDFSDMFAQTLVYGLFAAWKFDPNPHNFTKDRARHLIPKTNPFLREFFDLVTGAKLEEEPFAVIIEEVVQLLRLTDPELVMKDFGWAVGKKDPIFHFYETFLSAYDPKERERRGVYYTPEPVVSYIVRSVDHILKTDFNLPQGLADEAVTSKKKSTAIHKVLILDPACGTGTFLYHVIDLIRTQFQKSKKAGMWESYVREHLLPRLFGFELMMAPYAIAHLKLGLELAGLDQPDLFRQRWGYEFKPNERINVFLTNTLEEAELRVQRELYLLQFIATEANAASDIKRDLPIMVILGNPPYSGHSANASWKLDAEGKKNLTFIGRLIESYKQVDGHPLQERNPKWLQDDYVKFIRWAQWRIEKTGAGIFGMITNHSYLDNPTFRGMRQSLMQTFDRLYFLDLHGNNKKKEKCPDGSKDENVFDIEQGVSINIFIKLPGTRKASPKVYHADLYGLRQHKYERLLKTDITSTHWIKLSPTIPFYLFKRQDGELRTEYEEGWKLADIFGVNSVGVVTARDDLTIKWSEGEVWTTVNDFSSLPAEDARHKYELGEDAQDWKVAMAQGDLRSTALEKEKIVPILYRPFDCRFTYYTGRSRGFICRPRSEIMRHMLAGENLGLCIGRAGQVIDPGQWNIVFCSRDITEFNLYRRGGNNLFPLYLYPDPTKNGEFFTNGSDRHSNVNPKFINEASNKLKLKFLGYGKGDLKKTFGPEDIFYYLYAVLHSPAYRLRYDDFLRMDFPRVPLTTNIKIFRLLSAMGQELVALHLLESSVLSKSQPSYNVKGDNLVEKGYPKFSKDKVQINREQCFEGVPEKVWNFHVGGYQVCEKWLKDRRGRKLSFDDLMHYQKVIVALKETIRLMEEIDKAIPSWPVE